MSEQKAGYAIQKQEAGLKAIIRSDEIKGRFAEVIGGNAAGYISSVLIAVSENELLQKCSSTSIISAALRAATMRLSVEPSTGQAYLVPFGGKATLVVGWRGIYHMALRTGKYQYINIFKVYEGETVTEDRMRGIHSLSGHKQSDKVIGYMLSFGLRNGFAKTFYMTIEECDEHGAKYSKNYSRNDSLWKKDPHTMYKKTVMRLGLTRWGYLEPSDLQAMNSLDETDAELGEVVDAVAMSVVEEKFDMPDDQAMYELGFGPKPATKQPEPNTAEGIDPKEVRDFAASRGVDPQGLNEMLEHNNGDLVTTYEQLKAL